MKKMHGLLLALGAAVLATTAADLSAQRGRGRQPAGNQGLPDVTCASGATAGAQATAAQAAFNRSLIPGLA